MIGNGPAGFGRGASEKDQTLGTSPASYLTASIGYVTPDDEHHGRGPADPPSSRGRHAPRPRRADQAQSSQQDMTTPESTDRACLPLGKRGAFEGVARRHGRRRNPARTTPRSSLRTPTNQPRHHAQRWVEKVGRSIKGSDTPHPPPTRSRRPDSALVRHDDATASSQTKRDGRRRRSSESVKRRDQRREQCAKART